MAAFRASLAPAPAANGAGATQRLATLKTGAFWNRLGTRFLPFADVATRELPLARLLRLSLFQVSVGMAAVLLQGTLNRVMVVELHMSASLVAAMVSLPLLFAPARALIGFRSDHHASVLGWKRVPYIWFGTLMQFGGLAILPFALLVMTGGGTGPAYVGQFGAAAGFLLIGAGMHTTQTAGLALATDLAPDAARPRVVALLYVMLLLGMLVSAVVIGRLLIDFNPTRLVQIVQGVGALTMVLNLIALWKQEVRQRGGRPRVATAPFRQVWGTFIARPRTLRLLVAVGLGAAAFSTHDVLLEPYGGQVLGLGVGATTLLTAAWAGGMLVGFAAAARWLVADAEPHRLAGYGATIGIVAFLAVTFSAPAQSPAMLGLGAIGIGIGNGLFSVGTLIAAMAITDDRRLEGHTGLALGAWGAVQASAAGAAIGLSALLRDAVAGLASGRALGPVLDGPATAYAVVYGLEIALLIGTIVALGPLVNARPAAPPTVPARFGLSAHPI